MPLTTECPNGPRVDTAASFGPEDVVAQQSAIALIARSIRRKTIRGPEWPRAVARAWGLNTPALPLRHGRDARADAVTPSAEECRVGRRDTRVSRQTRNFLKLRLTRRVF
jgi:hypothetical protein